MKLEIDTTNKKIKLLEEITFDKLEIELERMFPNGEWKKFTLVKEVEIIQIGSPFNIPNPTAPDPCSPFYPHITYLSYPESSSSY